MEIVRSDPTAHPAAANDLGDGAAGVHHRPMDAIFSPRTVAVVGATEAANAVGRTVLRNLIGTPFGGTVYPVNPKRGSVLGIRAYAEVAALPEKPDLAVVVTPAQAVPGVISQCADTGVRAAVVISAGFRELGPEGAELEAQVLTHVRRGKMRLIGPNCLGVMNPIKGLNATFAAGMARPGNVAFLSQSGALCTAILDWSRRQAVGFSTFVSVGSMLDVGWGDLIDYFGDDPATHSIVIYMESIGDAKAFLSAAREVALTKPIIVIKPGRTEAAAKAAASHTGSLTGSDDVLEAAFRRAGVLRIDRLSDLFYMAEVLAKQPRPRGRRLTVVTNAGGPGVLASDALVSGGGELAALAAAAHEALNAFLPPHWSRGNPIDVLGDAGPDRYGKALEIAAKDPNSDGLLVILTPQDMTDATRTAEELVPYARTGKPVLASWMGGPSVEAGVDILNRAGIPTFPYPDTAAQAFNYMWRYNETLRGLYETPALPADLDEEGGTPDRDRAAAILRQAASAGRTILTEAESKHLLKAYHIPTTETVVAAGEEEAAAAAGRIGFPVAVKLHSLTLTHKTDVGGVKLDLKDADAVRRAFREMRDAVAQKAGREHFQGVTVQPMVKLPESYEIILGSSIDAQFGPVMLFGAGGQLVELFKDRSLALPPLNATLARRLMERTKIYGAFKGVRGRKPVDIAALEQVLVRFSQLVVEQPRIKEIDINPLLVSPAGMIALDARVILHPVEVPDAKLPRPAIRPYPVQYVSHWKTDDGRPVTFRPIRPEDEPLLVKFHQGLSEESVRMRYFQMLKLNSRIAHERLVRVCFNDYARELALVADYRDPKTGAHEVLGIARLSREPGTSAAEFAVVIADAWQGRGLGTELIRRLIGVAKEEGITYIHGDILPDNTLMQRLCEAEGFELRRPKDEWLVRAEMALS